MRNQQEKNSQDIFVRVEPLRYTSSGKRARRVKPPPESETSP
jgi:hypothetical protein